MVETATDTRPRFAPSVPPGDRPLSPHLQVWRWSVTMASSIAQRATGIALYVGSILLVVWLVAGALGADAYATVMTLLASPLGLLVLVGFTLAQMYHLSKGILHLIWDSGHQLDLPTARRATALTFVSAVVLTGALWGTALAVGQ